MLTKSTFNLAGGNPRRSLRIALLCLVAIALIAAAFDASAQAVNFNILNKVDTTYKDLTRTWFDTVRRAANKLFWILVSIDFAWTGVIYVLEKNDIGEIAISTAKKILTIGFFFSLLKFSDTWIPAILDSFKTLGITAGNASAATPDGIIMKGADVALAAFKAMDDMGALDKLGAVIPVTFIAIIIFLSFLFVAAQLLVTLVESYIAVGAGVILLGFGGSRWTTDFATKYLQFAVGTGLKLLMIYLIVGAGQTITADLHIQKDDLITSSLAAMGVALVYGYLAIQIPALAAAMLSGSPSMTAGALASTALTMGAAAAGAGAAAAATGGAAAAGTGGAAVGMGGLGKALGAGMQSAADLGKTGLAGAMHAASEVGGAAMGMAKEGIGSAVAGGAQSFGQAVSGSTGGKMADRIESGRGGSMSGANGPSLPAAPASSPMGSGASSNAMPSQSAGQPAGSGSGASQAGAPASSGVETATQGNAGSSEAQAPMGDASDVTFNNGPASGAQPQGGSASGGGGEKLHAKIRDLQGFVPQDAAQGGAVQINLGHTQD